jgi:hypothetical protein
MGGLLSRARYQRGDAALPSEAVPAWTKWPTRWDLAVLMREQEDARLL